MYIRVPEFVHELFFYKLHVQNKGKSALVHEQGANFFCTLTLKKHYFLYLTYAWFFLGHLYTEVLKHIIIS